MSEVSSKEMPGNWQERLRKEYGSNRMPDWTDSLAGRGECDESQQVLLRGRRKWFYFANSFPFDNGVNGIRGQI